ncbi:hypothetical protein [Bosea sp. AAP35]|uniref:hypothetical protein n=1 Tax=Bosea sp. AAP35 TaxID=1523417 RepID=UPI000A5BAC96|nr:hypothetical protein [Bosea sp. AAP35]
MSDALFRRHSLLALPLLCLGLAGCGSSGSSSGQPSAMQTLGNVVMFQSTTPPPADQLPTDEEDERLICPEVIIADGGAAVRAQSGPDSGSLRHQISILNVARECTPTGNGGFRLKVGVEGRILLGPAGGPGTYGATLTTLVTRGSTQVARRAARVGGTVASGQGGTDFSHVEDGIVVPAGRSDVEIIVSLGSGAATPARARRR